MRPVPGRSTSSDAAPAFRDFAWDAAGAGSMDFLEILRRHRSLARFAQELSFWTLISSRERPSLASAVRVTMLEGSYEVRVVPGGTEAVLFRNRGDEDMLVFQIPTGHDGVVHLVSDAPQTDRAWRTVQKVVRHAVADLSPVLLDQADFLSIAEGLNVLGEVEVSRLTARFRDDKSSIARGWKGSAASLRPSPSDAVNELDGRGAARTLTLHVEDRLSIHLRREAGATLYSGDYASFKRLVLDRLAASAHQRRQLLYKRVRAPRQPVDPVAVLFDVPLFGDTDSLRSVVDALSAVRGVGVAMLHRNPYLHLIVTSYEDGSSFDVMVTKPDEIAIYPSFRASMTAFSSLLQQVVDSLGAAEVRLVADRKAPSLENLFA